MSSANTNNILKFIRDPIHDIIRIEDQFIFDLIDTAVMQRLRYIRQLGLAWLVYPGAEHSRFTHSLGVYHLAGRAMCQLNQINGSTYTYFNDEIRNELLAAALLHDVGHGPFSHIFENVVRGIQNNKNVKNEHEDEHESWTVKIVKDDEKINEIFKKHSIDKRKVLGILGKHYKPHYVPALLSGQFDVDRFDYLLRDSHMTGVHYGNFDLEWMLRTLTVKLIPKEMLAGEGDLETLVIDGRRGLSGLEAYLMGRHYMYKHVYFHKTIRAAEQMLFKIIERAGHLLRDGQEICSNEAFVKMARGEALSVDEYLSLNDFVILGWIDEWSKCDADRTLKDLSLRLLRRKLMKPILIPKSHTYKGRKNNEAKLRDILDKAGFDPDYYMMEDAVDDIAYKGYMLNLTDKANADEAEIWFVDLDGKPCRLSSETESILVKAESALKFKEERWFVPKEVKDTMPAIKWD